MARRLVSPNSQLLARPISPSSISPDPRQRGLSISLQDSGSAFQDLLIRFQGCRKGTLQVLDWYKQSWKDLCEELRLLTDSSSAAEEDVKVDFRAKGTGFEGMATGMKRAVIHAESQVVKLCFKQRGKFSEGECKKSVESAFERMANDIWKLLGAYLQKSTATRAADSLRNLIKMQSEAEAIATQVKEMQVHFEETLRRHANLSSLTPEAKMQHVSFSVEEDDKMSEVSDMSRVSASAKDLTSDLKEQGTRLLQSFQRFTSSGNSEIKTSPVRREMDLVLRDMLLMVRNSKAEAGRLHEDKSDQRLERHLARIRTRIDTLCHNFEQGVVAKPRPVSVSPPLNEAVSEDIRQLKEVVGKQAAEIEKLRKEATLAVRMTSPIEPVHEDLQQLNEVQGSIMADIREMRQHMDRVFFATKDSGKEASAKQVLQVLRASSPHIQAETDSEFVQIVMDEIITLRKSTHSLLELVTKEGFPLKSLQEVAAEFVKQHKTYLDLKEQHDELFLRLIKFQSEGELETSYLQTRVKELETDLESLRMGRVTPDSSSSRAKRSVDVRSNLLDEENTVLSTENFILLHKLELAGKEKMQLLRIVEDLKRESKAKVVDFEEALEAEVRGNELQESLFPPHTGETRLPKARDPIQILNELEAAV